MNAFSKEIALKNFRAFFLRLATPKSPKGDFSF
jgi:hypothetical protein